MVALDREPERVLGRRRGEAAGSAGGAPILSVYTAHSPSPRITWKGSLRCQSMK